jgi:hypothetical protein
MKLVPIDFNKPDAGSVLDYALRYAALGWHVFPVWGAKDGKCQCKRICKSPAKHPVEHLVPRGQDDATTDEATIRRWYSAMPEAGVAIFLGPSGLCAIDIDPRNGGFETMDDIEAKHGPLVSDVLSFTQAGGEHRVFKLASTVNLPGKLGAGIDVKRNGYIVAEPTRGVSGVYEWEASSDPLDGAIPSPLPDWLRDIVPPTVAAEGVQPAASQGNRYVSPEQVLELKEALSFVSPDDYHLWVNIGQALHSAGGVGFGLWDSWSKISAKYDGAEMGKKWRSFRPGPFNIESVFKLAQDAGWVNPLSKMATEREAKLKALADEHNRETMYETIEPDSVTVVRPFPVPMLDELARWINVSQGIKHSVATQMAVISVVSLATSRRYASEAGDGSHLYQMLSAQTVGELRSVHNAVAQIMRDTGLRRLLREQRFSSPSAFFKTLMRSPACLYLSADWGAMTAFARRQPSGIIEQVLHLTAHAFSQRDIMLDNPEELGIKNAGTVTDDMPVIRCPALSVFALSSQSMLSNAFSVSEIGRGAIEQFIFHAGKIDPDGDPQPSEVPPWVIDRIRTVRGLPNGGNEFDLASIFNGNAELIPALTTVTFTAQPSEHYATFDALGAHRQARPLTLAARVNLRRIAVAMAAFANPDKPIVTREILDWCAAFIGDRLSESLAALNLLGGSEDGKATLYQVVLEALTDAGANGMSEWELTRSNYKFRSLARPKRDELISMLIEDTQIIEQRGKQGNGKRLVAAQFVQAVQK